MAGKGVVSEAGAALRPDKHAREGPERGSTRLTFRL